MKCEKFTPGEWVHCILGGEGGYPFVFENKTGEGIASVFIQQGNTEKAIANAALIAAAPAMYALLKMISDPATFMGAQTNQSLRAAIENILTKARGEE